MPVNPLCFIPECYFDTVLVKKILQLKNVNHQKGCANVAKTMEKQVDFAVGIIDGDKKQLDYLKNFSVVYEAGNLKLYRHNDSQVPKFFIQVCPALEQWMLKIYEEGAADLKALGIPETIDGLKKITKHSPVKEEDASKLCKPLLADACAETQSIKTLKHWLSHFHEHGRNADLPTLKTISD